MSSRLATTVFGASWRVLNGATGLTDKSVGITILFRTFSNSKAIKSANIAK